MVHLETSLAALYKVISSLVYAALYKVISSLYVCVGVRAASGQGFEPVVADGLPQ